MSTPTIPLPARMEHLPRQGPYPVPPVFGVDERGVPDFTVIEPAAWNRIVYQRRCAMCGDPLKYHMVFIGGPESVASRSFLDPAMHEECARYAMAVCPFLAMGKGYTERPARVDGRGDDKLTRPERFAFYFTRGFAVRVRRDQPTIRADRPPKIEWVEEKAG